jgi:hypothetical protein
MTRAELLARISSEELTEWFAFYAIEPFGAEASYFGHAITASTVANVNRRKGHKAIPIEDFMPKFERPKEQEHGIEGAINFAKTLTVALGGKILTKE